MIIKIKGCKFSRSRAIARSNSNAVDFNDKQRILLFKFYFALILKNFYAFGNLRSPRTSLTFMSNLQYRLSTITNFLARSLKFFGLYCKFCDFLSSKPKIFLSKTKILMNFWAKFVIFDHRNPKFPRKSKNLLDL